MAGGGFWLLNAPTTRTHVETTGVVVDLLVSSGSDGSTYAPVIEYVGPDGTVYRITSNLYRDPSPGIGDTVGVLYSPDDPSDAAEKTVLRIIIPTILLVVGIIFLAVGVGMGIRGFASGGRVSPTRVVVPGAVTSDPLTGSQDPPDSRPTVAQFRRVEPRGPDAKGRFQYRVVARDENGTQHYSEWLDEDPTTAMVTVGVDDVRLEWRGDQSRVVDFPS